MFHRLVIVATVVIAAVIASAAWAADLEGKVQSVDTYDRTVTLDNGTKVWLSDGVAIDSLKEGAEVRVSYEEKDGKPVASTVEIK